MRASALLCALLLAATAACGDDDSTGPSNETVIEMRDNTFNPATATVSRGTTVRWRNVGNNPHNTTSSTAGLWASSNLGNGGSFTRVFDTAGTFSYTCTLHPGMNGTVVVQ